MKNILININDFKKLIDRNGYYIDKTLLIDDVLDKKITFYIRPNGFGKTINMSMLYYFFSLNEKENAYLFHDLKIAQDKNAMLHQNKYPVIFISLKQMKGNSFEKQLIHFQTIIKQWLHENIKEPDQNEPLYNLYHGQADYNLLSNAFFYIMNYLKNLYHQNVIVLIDDYDSPLYHGFINHFNSDANQFIIDLVHSIVDNPVLFRAVFTGQTSLKKEHKLINTEWFNTVFSNTAYQTFGFSKSEIQNLLVSTHQINNLDLITKYFGGYIFNDELIYHPQWLMQYLSSQSDNENFEIDINNDDQIFIDLLTKQSFLIETELNKLLSNQTITKKVNKDFCYSDLSIYNNYFSYLINCGLLTNDNSANHYLAIQHLKLPNLTVKKLYLNTLYSWYENYILKQRNKFVDALFNHQTKNAQQIISDIINAPITPMQYNNKYYQNLLKLLLGPLMQSIVNETTYIIYYRLNKYESKLASINLNICSKRESFFKTIKERQPKLPNDQLNFELLVYQNNCFISER